MISFLSTTSLPRSVYVQPEGDCSSDAVAPVEPVYRISGLSNDDSRKNSITPYSLGSSLGSLLDVCA